MSRAYKNKKYNKDNYIKFGVSPKYFGLQAKRFPGSVKKAYCDIDRDEEAEVFFTKRRSPAVRKNYDCLTVSNFAPVFGPKDLSQTAPEIGPADLEAVEAPEITEGTAAIVHRFFYETGQNTDYYRNGVFDLDLIDGDLQITGTTEFAKADYPSTSTQYKEAQLYDAEHVALSKDGSTYAERTRKYVSGSNTYVINIYNKVGGNWQLQSTINMSVWGAAVWLNEDGTELLSYGLYDMYGSTRILSYVRYKFTDGEWVIVGPETGKSYLAGSDHYTKRAIHVSDDFKYITHCFYYTAGGIHNRFLGVVVFEWNETEEIYETYNNSYESLANNWSENQVQFPDMDNYDDMHEAHFDRDNDVLKIVYVRGEGTDIKISSYTAETKTFETSMGDREANIWGNDTPLDDRTGYNSATHTQTIANSGGLGVSMSKDGNHMVTASDVEGYKLLEWNAETLEYEVLASLAYDNKFKAYYNHGRGLQIIDRNNFIVLGYAHQDYPQGELYHYQLNDSNTLEYVGRVDTGYYDSHIGRLSKSWTAIA
jgi:hypothetical protein